MANANPELACAAGALCVENDTGDWFILLSDVPGPLRPGADPASVHAANQWWLEQHTPLLPPADRLDAAGKWEAICAVIPPSSKEEQNESRTLKLSDDTQLCVYRWKAGSPTLYIEVFSNGEGDPAILDLAANRLRSIQAWLAAQPKEAKDGQ